MINGVIALYKPIHIPWRNLLKNIKTWLGINSIIPMMIAAELMAKSDCLFYGFDYLLDRYFNSKKLLRAPIPPPKGIDAWRSPLAKSSSIEIPKILLITGKSKVPKYASPYPK